MKTIWMVKSTTHLGVSYYYAGVSNKAEALLMAARNGIEGDEADAQAIPNKHGIQPGQWKSAN